MHYQLFSKLIGNTDHTSVCRFCLTKNAIRRIETKLIAQLFKQITSDNLLLSADHPTFVCSKCETNLRTIAKYRNDIMQIERCWTQYIDEMHLLEKIKVEELDDDSVKFETVEMIIEPVDQMYSSSSMDGDVDFLDVDSRPEYGSKYESYNYEDGGSIDVYETSSDLDDDQENRITETLPSIEERTNCENCNTAGLTPVELRIHQRNCHPEVLDAPQFSCDICQKAYSSRYGILTHMKRHKQGSAAAKSKRIDRYQCSSCDERFSKKTLLTEHELCHSGAALHVCHICGIGKRTKSLMTSHLKTHNPDYVGKKKTSARTKSSKRYYTCWICPVRIDFNSLDELKIHRKNLHHDFQCKFCKNGFMTNEALQSHMLIHGNQDRPHLCKICGGTFAKIGHLKSHIQGKHAEQKPYPCQKCPKGFVHRYQLQSHIRIFHDKIKAFHCTECPTSFGHAKSRVWHMRTVHKM